TQQGVDAAHVLAKMAGVDPEVYGLDMLKAGADLSQKTVQELITLDAKEFALGNSKVEIAQVNTVDIAEVTARQADIEAKINEVIAAKGLDL
ncbi:DHHA2 domain-containing protein, partial [Staphylococcus epidermidis]|uniref:DHHA2 domain-containing protein n=1 Tax=Staphylococcus epidermidis TaxID=1282 RepID=UPI0028CB9A70